jgi:hypothetical protein
MSNTKPFITMEEYFQRFGGWTKLVESYSELGGDVNDLPPELAKFVNDELALEKAKEKSK